MTQPGDNLSDRPTRKRSWRSWVRLMVVLAAVRIFLATTGFPQTIDEPVHILCGLEWLERGTYTIEEQHPPLARIAVALGPYLTGSTIPGEANVSNMYVAGNAVLYENGRYGLKLMLARLGVLPFFIGICALLAVWAKRWFGSAGALLSVALLTTTPPVLAHAGLATTDMVATTTLFAAIGSLFWLTSSPSIKTALVAGGCIGLAVLSKFSSLPFLGLCLLAIGASRWLFGPKIIFRDRALYRKSAYYFAAGFLACCLLVWAGLRFSVGPLLPPDERPHEPLLAIAQSLSIQPADFNSYVEAPVYPAAEIFQGILQVREHNLEGHPSYLLGEVRTHGWWYFFPVVFSVKTPIPFLLLGLIAVVGMLIVGIRHRDWRLPALVGSMVSIMGFAMTANINLGVRHVLVLYPLLALSIASLGPLLVRSRRVKFGIVALLCWQTTESVLAHPDYLPYFNQIVGDHPEDFRVDSDLDWGQDLYRLVQATQELKIEKLYLHYFGTAYPPASEMPETELLLPGEQKSGWIAISLSSLKLHPQDYGWLEEYEPHSLIGKSIRLYYIPEESEQQ